VQTTARPVLLLKLLGGELPPEEWEIEGVQVGIGRLDDSDITLPHRSVSRHHARIVPSANGYEVEDLGSTNGTWLNDRPLNDRTMLSDGDSLMVGDIPLVVELIHPQPQRQPEVFDVPQLPAGGAAPARAPQAPEGGASTVFYELDAALAAAGPAEPVPPLQPAQPPADYQRTQSAPLLTDFEKTVPPPSAQPPVAQPASPPADYLQAPPLQPAQRPADYKPTPPPFDPTPAQPPAGYRRTPPPAPPPPPVQLPPRDVEVPRAWDDTPSTRLDLPGASDLADNDEHPTLIAQVPVEQFQAPSTVEPTPPGPLPAPREQSPGGPQTSQREPWPLSPQPPRYEPAPLRTTQPAQSAPSVSGTDLSAASMIELAEHLATALRVLKGDLALAMWLFEHAGGPPAAQEFVNQVRRLQADPNNPQDLADLLESAPVAARLLEAAILLVNVLSSLDPPGGIDNQLEADAADLQPVARS
jgi:hypothetical protein